MGTEGMMWHWLPDITACSQSTHVFGSQSWARRPNIHRIVYLELRHELSEPINKLCFLWHVFDDWAQYLNFCLASRGAFFILFGDNLLQIYFVWLLFSRSDYGRRQYIGAVLLFWTRTRRRISLLAIVVCDRKRYLHFATKLLDFGFDFATSTIL